MSDRLIDRDEIRARLKASGVTIRQLAAEVGMNEANISRWLAAEPSTAERTAARIIEATERLTTARKRQR